MDKSKKQEFYDPTNGSEINIPFVSDNSGNHFFLRANVLIVIAIFVLVIVLLVGGFLLLKSKQSDSNKKNNGNVVNSSPTPTPTPPCRPRPACLDTEPRCQIAETPDMCPPPYATPNESPISIEPTPEAIFCTLEARECPDGSFVGRQPPNCEFAPCPPSI